MGDLCKEFERTLSTNH